MRQCLRLGTLAVATLAMLAVSQASAQDKHDGSTKDHVLLRPEDVKWAPAPPLLPPGAKAAVLAGDPSQAGPFVMRIKLPDGYKVPPHWHSCDENVTVLQGTIYMGKGDTLEAKASQALAAGSFALMPKEMHHFAWTKGDTVIQVHGMGPFDIHYVNAADDPRKQQ